MRKFWIAQRQTECPTERLYSLRDEQIELNRGSCVVVPTKTRVSVELQDETYRTYRTEREKSLLRRKTPFFERKIRLLKKIVSKKSIWYQNVVRLNENRFSIKKSISAKTLELRFPTTSIGCNKKTSVGREKLVWYEKVDFGIKTAEMVSKKSISFQQKTKKKRSSSKKVDLVSKKVDLVSKNVEFIFKKVNFLSKSRLKSSIEQFNLKSFEISIVHEKKVDPATQTGF